MKVLAIAACAVLALSSLNCRTMTKGFPKLPNVTVEMESQELENLLGDDWLTNYRNCGPNCEKKALRNEIIDAHLTLIDSRFFRFERTLHKQGVGLGVGTDWAQLAISAASTTIGFGMTKVAFGAASTAIVGAKASFDKRAFYGQALPTLIAQMVAERESIRVKILCDSTQTVLNYSLYMALSDIRKFEKAGSIQGALQSIAEGAGKKTSSAREQLRNFTR